MKRFIGTWQLVSYQLKTLDNQISYPLEKDAIGYLLYNEDGYMSVAVMVANRPLFKSEDARAGTSAEKISIADDYISYCGRYKVQGNKVIHSVKVSSFPNWIGTNQERTFKFEDNKLTLSTPDPILIAGKQQVGLLIWERVHFYHSI